MHAGEALLGWPLWQKIEAIYRSWVRTDYFNDSSLDELNSLNSIWELIGAILEEGESDKNAKVLRPTRLSNLDLSLKDFLSIPNLILEGTPQPLELIVFRDFCYNKIPALLEEASVHNASSEGKSEFAAMVAASGHDNWENLTKTVMHPAAATHLAQVLLLIFWDESRRRTLWSYFKKDRYPSGYHAWSATSASGCGRPLKPHITPTATGVVKTEIFNHSADTDSSVKPYEWCSEFRLASESEVPDAIAYGMVYLAARNKGESCSSISDLRWASAVVSNIDVSQVLAFLSQHGDAPALFESGDICFLWLWERKAGSPKGIGAECLLAALTDIKKRFSSVKVLVASLRPAQFTNWGKTHEPPLVQVAKQEALEKLEYFIEKLAPQQCLDGQLRFIVSKYRGAGATLAALSIADLVEGEWHIE